MKRGLTVLVAAGMLLGAQALSAQAKLGIGGGLTMPTGDYKDADNSGFHGTANVEFPAGPVAIRVEGLYSQTNHKNGFDGNTKIIGGGGAVVYHFKVPGMVTPYVLGSVGMYNAKITVPSVGFDSSETKFGFGVGGGVNLALSTVAVFAEIRYLSVATSGSSTAFIPITVGVRFGL